MRQKWLELKWAVQEKWESLVADKTKLLILVAFVFLAIGIGLGYSQKAQAQAPSFNKGEVLQHMLSVCLDKEDAIEILKADSEKGKDEASKVWDSKEKCATVPVQGLAVGNVVFSIAVKRDGQSHKAKVVEIVDIEGKVQAYFITSLPVHDKAVKGTDGAPVYLKPERNA